MPSRSSDECLPSHAHRRTPSNEYIGSLKEPGVSFDETHDPLPTADSTPDGALLRKRIHELMPAARNDLRELVSFPSVADPSIAPRAGILDAASFAENALLDLGLGIASRTMPDGTTAVIGTAPAPDGSPTVLLYGHYDVQPPGDSAAWSSSPWELTERDGRWYGRGTADSKGNLVAHLTALRALEGKFPCGIKVVFEGSEEWPSPGVETLVLGEPDVLRADAILIADSGSSAPGEPAMTVSLRGSVFVVVTVRTLSTPVHSGRFGGAAPDALAALVRMLGSLWNERGSVALELPTTGGAPAGASPSEARFRADAGVLDGVDLLGDGPIGDRIWTKPSVTVLGIDCPRIAGSLPAIPAEVSARVSLRVPPGVDSTQAEEALVAHLRRAAPWNAQVDTRTEATSEPFAGGESGPAHTVFYGALRDAYGREPVLLGQGGAIPVCGAFRKSYPDAEILLFGVEEPLCAIHSPNESVDPGEIERIALAEALFLRRFAG